MPRLRAHVLLSSAGFRCSGRKCASSRHCLCSGHWHAATQLNCAFVDESAESLRDGFLGSRELILSVGHPRHFTVGDHAGGHGFQKQFSESHGTDVVQITLIGLKGACMTCLPFFMAKNGLKCSIDLFFVV